MMKYFKFFGVLVVFSCVPSLAGAGNMDFSLMTQAVTYGAQADAYNIYCKKDSALAQGFLDKFQSMDAVGEREFDALRNMKNQSFRKAHADLMSEEPKCKDLEFMMARLEVMKKLKDVSYRLNGIDPQTVPQPEMPALEDLLPAPRHVSAPMDL